MVTGFPLAITRDTHLDYRCGIFKCYVYLLYRWNESVYIHGPRKNPCILRTNVVRYEFHTSKLPGVCPRLIKPVEILILITFSLQKASQLKPRSYWTGGPLEVPNLAILLDLCTPYSVLCTHLTSGFYGGNCGNCGNSGKGLERNSALAPETKVNPLFFGQKE